MKAYYHGVLKWSNHVIHSVWSEFTLLSSQHFLLSLYVKLKSYSSFYESFNFGWFNLINYVIVLSLFKKVILNFVISFTISDVCHLLWLYSQQTGSRRGSGAWTGAIYRTTPPLRIILVVLTSTIHDFQIVSPAFGVNVPSFFSGRRSSSRKKQNEFMYNKRILKQLNIELLLRLDWTFTWCYPLYYS